LAAFIVRLKSPSPSNNLQKILSAADIASSQFKDSIFGCPERVQHQLGSGQVYQLFFLQILFLFTSKLFPKIDACIVLVLYLKNFFIAADEKLTKVFPETHPMIPEYSPIPFTSYYSQNCAGIIDTYRLGRQHKLIL